MAENDAYILGIESSCDETAAAVTANDVVLSNIIASQKVHEQYGGIVPELASRAHQKNIIPVTDRALHQAGLSLNRLSAVAYTSGPGLIGSLMVGSSFAKALALSLGIPVIAVNHMQAHVISHFARRQGETHKPPAFPFLCLTVSGGHTQIVLVNAPNDLNIIGQTQDDAAGEAFDKTAKILGLPYPGGPVMDKLAEHGNPLAFKFPITRMAGLDYSFSGLKTAVLYFIRDAMIRDDQFIEKNLPGLCASIQHTIVAILIEKLVAAAETTGVREVALSGGVSANRVLRKALSETGHERGWNTYVPAFEFCTDNAAMIAVTGFYLYKNGIHSAQDEAPFARFSNF